MKRFVVPPNWPTPPRRSWMPPKTWRPDPAWPAAPEGWKFWVDGKGNPVRGPVGRYAGPSRRAVFAGAGGIALFLALNIWALSAIGLFDSDQPESQAVRVVDDSTPTPTPTPTPQAPTTVPSAPPKVEKSSLPPLPRKTRTTKKVETSERTTPKPTKTTTTPKPPTTTPSHRPTREELLAEYCRQQGWPPEVCDPDNWNQDPQHP
ncbi:hypothetical protein EV138_2602 [Kribbella voronezhensis]|uniref:Uncharacterized protein n=2 Tax=Kribbella voronezhensis TaxID=2512212 RepID=A0A4R7TCG3_9ACTN|nr:hypothetical protein EV138_2602 [Kribbella voronezhensis]